MPIKFSFIYYRNYITWTRVKLPVFFEEFDLVYVFWFLFSFNYHCQLVKGRLLQKSAAAGGLQPPPASPSFYGPGTRNGGLAHFWLKKLHLKNRQNLLKLALFYDFLKIIKQ